MTPRVIQFATDVLRFPLRDRQAALLTAVYVEAIRVIALRLGRRSGKGRIAALIAIFEAVVNAPIHLRAVPQGERVYVVIIASSREQARIIHRYCRQFLKRPSLEPLIVRETADEIELRTGVVIATLPCHAASVRGLAVAVAIFDELAWYQGVTGSPIDAKELWDAVVPSVAQFPAGRIIAASTPRFASGFFYDLCQRASSGKFDDEREFHASTVEMAPNLATFIERERLKDPSLARREFDAEWDSGIGAALDADSVRAAARLAPETLPPVPGTSYVIACDAGFTGDAFTVIVGHASEAGVVVDRIASWRGTKAAPVQIDPTLDAIADHARAYGDALVLLDQFSAEVIRQNLVSRGVRVEARPWTNDSKIDALAALRRTLYASRLSIPGHTTLISELVSLEQRPTPSGRPRIAAPGRSHDDFATALLALVSELADDGREPAGATIEPPPITFRFGASSIARRTTARPPGTPRPIRRITSGLYG